MTRKTKTIAVSAMAGTLLLVLLAGTAAAQGGIPWRGFGGWGHGMMGGGMMYPGWSGNCTGGAFSPAQCPAWGDAVPGGTRLTMGDAEAIAAQYLANYGNDDLQVAEIMQFSQNFYVEVHEASTGIGAMELLIDPYTGAVHPEPGPNMMWNTKYGHMNGMGMMGGRYLGSSGAMRISGDQAVNLAQKWLDAHMSGVMAGDEAEAFYGYYTIHTMTDGAISGMLSVNGYTGQVWYHSWHGDFIDMTGGDEAV
ncbi:MAG: hypothetical protein H6649_07320 [Caldilineae bacterium]|nr:hypothetical protein [Anaerolineae bacterium]MCB0198935.1 hypothetical protein [Anaerolineae bacterium]MCB0204298.1 hypothetical protein [Anaerolineae bacterium]MCB0252319.1 hypothetical protein [Anaerolineae bacterium]MCB9153849.1 hypothetical protein [Caldilineae bacterium]